MNTFDNNENNNGELNGFDSVNGVDTSENGYTVTPDGGYYTKQKDEIIQDDISAEEPKTDNVNFSENNDSRPKNSFFPNGVYGNYGTGNNSYNTAPMFTSKPPKQRKKKNGKYGAGVVIAAALLAAVIGAVSSVSVLMSFNKKGVGNSPTTPVTPNNVSINVDETAESVVEAVAEKVTPSVVGIRTTTSVVSFFGGNSESTGEGSGVVYSSDGYIITNYHVISGAVSNRTNSKIEVYADTLDSKSYEATVVGYNISSDLAVIKINAKGLTPIEIGDSGKLKIGQYVVTVGNPGGLEFMDSVSFGVISGLNRVVSSNSNMALIQTSAAINPGNSGGALVNTKGQLIGITSSKIVSEEFEGMGFAIPADTTVKICKNIIEKQNSPEPYIGITLSEKYTSSVLSYYGYPSGAVVLSVADGSPADSAGIAKGDIITEFNGTEIKEYTMLNDILKTCEPKQKVSAKIYRSGRYYTTTITVGSNNAVG